MNFLRLLPVFLSFGLLAAHFSRAGLFPLVLLSLLFPFLLLVRRAWAARAIQLLLLAGAVEWIRAMLGYISIRKESGEDWTRLAVILVTVALLTAGSGLVFYAKALRQRYRKEKHPD